MKQEIKDFITEAVIEKILEGYTYIDQYGTKQHEEGMVSKIIGRMLYDNYNVEIRKIVEELLTKEMDRWIDVIDDWAKDRNCLCPTCMEQLKSSLLQK